MLKTLRIPLYGTVKGTYKPEPDPGNRVLAEIVTCRTYLKVVHQALGDGVGRPDHHLVNAPTQ